ncbi:unnamed protein product, partial [Sphagnum balticum]
CHRRRRPHFVSHCRRPFVTLRRHGLGHRHVRTGNVPVDARRYADSIVANCARYGRKGRARRCDNETCVAVAAATWRGAQNYTERSTVMGSVHLLPKSSQFQ